MYRLPLKILRNEGGETFMYPKKYRILGTIMLIVSAGMIWVGSFVPTIIVIATANALVGIFFILGSRNLLLASEGIRRMSGIAQLYLWTWVILAFVYAFIYKATDIAHVLSITRWVILVVVLLFSLVGRDMRER